MLTDSLVFVNGFIDIPNIEYDINTALNALEEYREKGYITTSKRRPGESNHTSTEVILDALSSNLYVVEALALEEDNQKVLFVLNEVIIGWHLSNYSLSTTDNLGNNVEIPTLLTKLNVANFFGRPTRNLEEAKDRITTIYNVARNRFTASTNSLKGENDG